MVGLELLVGSDAFWARASSDIQRARRRVYVQAMTFEGDIAGGKVAAAITASAANDRRVLVDDYSRFTVSDRSVNSLAGRIDPALRAEVKATDAMFRGLIRAGAPVRLTNPIGRLMANYPARNHKKLIVADDVAYIGGINFSDHNFAWHDFMLRLEGAAAADPLAGDFEATFDSRPRPWSADAGDITLISLDGRANAAGFGRVIRLIEDARREITVISPYLTFPFTDALARAAGRGVTVRLITPLANNKPTVRNYLLAAAARAGFEIMLLPGMSHLKGLLIDSAHLVVGSSNFDFVSLAAEEELLAVISRPEVITDFQRLIIAPAVAGALPVGAWRGARWAGRASELALRLAERVALAARGAPRTAMDWPV